VRDEASVAVNERSQIFFRSIRTLASFNGKLVEPSASIVGLSRREQVPRTGAELAETTHNLRASAVEHFCRHRHVQHLTFQHLEKAARTRENYANSDLRAAPPPTPWVVLLATY
jgi:hypothetical protein